jgi:hypothetical protein
MAKSAAVLEQVIDVSKRKRAERKESGQGHNYAWHKALQGGVFVATMLFAHGEWLNNPHRNSTSESGRALEG